eukprot:272454_1
MALSLASGSTIKRSDLDNFLIENNLWDIQPKLNEFKLEFDHIKSIENTDLDELCKELQLQIGEKIRFKKAVKSLKEKVQNDLQEKKEKMIKGNIKQVKLNTKQKITIIGDSCVGKSWLTHRLKFDDAPANDIGYTTKTAQSEVLLDVNEGLAANYSVYDTAGQKQYHDIVPLYFTGALAIVIMYDICDTKTFENVRKIWIPMINNHGKAYDKVLIIGNKLDMKHNRTVTNKEATIYAIEQECVYMELSCKTGENIDMLLSWIKTQTASRVQKEGITEESDKLALMPNTFSDVNQNKKGKCCK